MKDSLARDTALRAHERISDQIERDSRQNDKIKALENKVAHHEQVLNKLFVHLGIETYTVPEVPEVPAVPAIPAHWEIRKVVQRDAGGRFK
jgi:uncharacterized coiled-coil protein SlyX